ncbi:MAG: CaiB/BaiF CoA transferase family protein [Steroidobacteraceae bacterium]
MPALTLLAGTSVLDLSRLLPGPLATWHLAGLGASVAKIERAPDDDYARRVGPLDGEASHFYRHLNEGKDIVPLDLGSAQGRAALLERVSTGDLVVESFRPGVLERLGLGFDRLYEANPSVCLVSISGYGSEGGMAAAAGHDINYLALSGWMSELMPAYGEPTLPGVQIGDVLGGALTAAFAAVSALLHARRTGVGCHVDVSMTAALIASNPLGLSYARAGAERAAPGRDLLSGGVPCYGLYRTRDGRYLAVGALEAKFWVRFCEVLGRTDLAVRHWQNDQEIAGTDACAVRAELERVFAGETLSHWQQVFSKADCCVTPVLRMDEVLRHPVCAAYLGDAAATDATHPLRLRPAIRVLA